MLYVHKIQSDYQQVKVSMLTYLLAYICFWWKLMESWYIKLNTFWRFDQFRYITSTLDTTECHGHEIVFRCSLNMTMSIYLCLVLCHMCYVICVMSYVLCVLSFQVLFKRFFGAANACQISMFLSCLGKSNLNVYMSVTSCVVRIRTSDTRNTSI